MSDSAPLLKEHILPFTTGDGAKVVRVFGGLRYIRPNKSPYFTFAIEWHGREDEYGVTLRAISRSEEDVAVICPEFELLRRLFLSDIDGVPLHNGFYYLMGACGGMGERYHMGNAYPPHTEDECLSTLAQHLRISLVRAEALKREMLRTPLHPNRIKIFRDFVEQQHPRWKEEANECIRRFNPVVYGDEWPGSGNP